MREPAYTWSVLHQLKARRCERMQERLSDCRRALEHCDRELARCRQDTEACTTRLADCDAALMDKTGVGGSINIDTILQHERFRTVLVEAVALPSRHRQRRISRYRAPAMNWPPCSRH